MAEIIVINANGLPLARHPFSDMLWRMGPDCKMRNIEQVELKIMNEGMPHRVTLQTDDGMLVSDGEITQQYYHLGDRLFFDAGKCLLTIYPRHNPYPMG